MIEAYGVCMGQLMAGAWYIQLCGGEGGGPVWCHAHLLPVS